MSVERNSFRYPARTEFMPLSIGLYQCKERNKFRSTIDYFSDTIVFLDSDFSCPQAAKISRPRGVRIGAGNPRSSK